MRRITAAAASCLPSGPPKLRLWVARLSAEHGVGKIKAGFLETMYGHEAMVESARLKLQLDPAGQLGRGNLFSEKLLDELVQKGGA